MSENWYEYYLMQAEKAERIAEQYPHAGKYYKSLAGYYRDKANRERNK